MELNQCIEAIESWNPNAIQKVINHIQGTNLEPIINTRYEPIIKFIEEKSLEALLELPQKIVTGDITKKTNWIPDKTSQSIIATLPIRELDLGGIPAQEVPEWLKYINYEEVTEIDLSYNYELLEIPNFVYKCTSLKKIYIYESPIKTISSDIANLLNLEELHFSMENVEISQEVWSMLEKLGALKKMKKLSITHYPYDILPVSWLEFTNLEELNLEEGKKLGERFYSIMYESPYDEAIVRPTLTTLYSPQIITSFLKIATKTEDDQTENDLVFKYLESTNKDVIKNGLELIKNNKTLYKQAELRYLKFIRIILNNPNAALEQIIELPDTQRIFELIEKVTKCHALNFSYLQEEDSRLVVDILGAIASNAVDVDTLLTEVKSAKNKEKLKQIMSREYQKIYTYITEEFCRGILSNGWLQKILQIFSHSVFFNFYDNFYLNHTGFNLANESPFLRAFYIFVAAHNVNGELAFDIAQSDAPNLTEIIWLFEEVPTSNWLDVEPSLPLSPLLFQRTLTYTIGGENEKEFYGS